jgi:putative ABC transport system permease protein
MPPIGNLRALLPELHASLAGEFLSQMPDMEASDAMMSGISFLAILIGGIGVFNTMLMAVFERTREIGVLRALGWRRLAILVLILKEALILGVIGGLVGIGIAIGLVSLLGMEPTYGPMITPLWEWDVFLRAIVMAVALSMIGGLYPAYRATRLEPVEALRYE